MMYECKTIISEMDASVNFIINKDGNILEARYVRREDDYFSAYLSSHVGCNKACRFCHLTQTNQTKFIPADTTDYYYQAKLICRYYALSNKSKAKKVYFNFMARGEALDNPSVVLDFNYLDGLLKKTAEQENLSYRSNISTIMPKTFNKDLSRVFGKNSNVALYYSLYSMKDSFRQKWLPKSMKASEALDKLKKYQEYSGNTINLHWAYIKGENDDLDTTKEIIDAIKSRELKTKINIVRYNTFSNKTGEETEERIIKRNFDLLNKELPHPRNKVVTRVGTDVKASCGMFVK